MIQTCDTIIKYNLLTYYTTWDLQQKHQQNGRWGAHTTAPQPWDC